MSFMRVLRAFLDACKAKYWDESLLFGFRLLGPFSPELALLNVNEKI
jgi:hypothetical protein